MVTKKSARPTKRQQEVLVCIQESVALRGYPPTFREIGSHMGIRSTNGVNDHLRALERKGFLTRNRGARTLRLTPAGVEACAAGRTGGEL